MGMVIGDNFNYQGKKPLDSRMLFDTIADMKAYNENYLPDITLAFNKADGKMYVFNRTNDVDDTTGKWREFEGGATPEVIPEASTVAELGTYLDGLTDKDYHKVNLTAVIQFPTRDNSTMRLESSVYAVQRVSDTSVYAFRNDKIYQFGKTTGSRTVRERTAEYMKNDVYELEMDTAYTVEDFFDEISLSARNHNDVIYVDQYGTGTLTTTDGTEIAGEFHMILDAGNDNGIRGGKIYQFNEDGEYVEQYNVMVDVAEGTINVIKKEGTKSVYLTQTEFNALTQEEQDDPTKDYYIISNETAIPAERIIFRDLDDVAIVNPEEGDVVRYNSTTEKWENKEIADINADYTLSKYSLGKAVAPTDYGARKGGVGNEWETFHMYPMFKGDTIKVVNSLAVQNPWKLMVVYDANKDFVTSFGGNAKTYTFENDGYVTFITCTTSSSTPTVQVTRAHKIDYSVNLQENALNQSVERNVLVDISAYLQPNNYLKNDNTLVGFTGRYSYKDIPLQKGDMLQVYLGTGPSVSGSTQSLIVRNDSTIVNTGQGMPQLYATEDCTYSCCWDNVNFKAAYVRLYRPQATTVGTLITNLENTKADKESITPIKRAAIGDSITAGNEGNTGNSYSRTAARLVGERVQLQNLGYWGHTMKQSLATTAYNAISAGTNIITINFGSNDIFVLGSSQWGDVDEVIAKPRADLADNVSSLESLRLFIEKCRENKPEATIYYITAIKRGADETHMAFNEKVIALCNYYSIQVLDAYHECSIRQSDTVYKRDGIHPNDAGCLVYGRWLANKINFL